MFQRNYTTATIVGSSAEELTSQITDSLINSLDNLHQALEIALAGHAILPLYQWLYKETLPYIRKAACAIDANQHIGLYITTKAMELGDKWLEPAYKNVASGKKDLLDQLVELYKAIMQLCVRAGTNLMTANDQISSDAIVSVSNQLEEIQLLISEEEQTIADDQVRIQNRLNFLTATKFIEDHPDLKNYKRALETQLIQLTQTFTPNLFDFNETDDPGELLKVVKTEIAQVKALAIEEVKVDTDDLLTHSPAKLNMERLFEILKNGEVELTSLLTEDKEEALTLKNSIAKAENLKTELARQIHVINTLISDEKDEQNVELTMKMDDELTQEIDAVAKIAKEQGNRWSQWHSNDKKGVQGALTDLNLSLIYIQSMAVVDRHALKMRQEELQEEINTINKKILELKQAEMAAKRSREETVKLRRLFENKKNQITDLLPAAFLKQQAIEKRLVERNLNQAKSAYLLRLETQKNRLMQKINFSLPSPKPLAFFAGVSSLSSLGVLGVAVAAFTFKVAAFAFIVSNPIGWMTGIALSAIALISTASVMGTKAYNRNVKNKLLQQYDKDIQQDLFKENETLKKEKNFSSRKMRHLKMKHAVKIKAEIPAEDGNIACQVLGQESKQIPLYWNVGTKQLLFKAFNQTVPVAADTNEFAAQIKRYSAAPAA